MHASKFFRYWAPVFVWMVLICVGSTDLMSAEHTSRIIGPILRWFQPMVSPLQIAEVQFIVRKAAHVSEYAVLALLSFRALVRTFWPERVAFAATITLFCCASFAALDEFHQSFVPSRTASLGDVVIDMFGAAIGLGIYQVFRRRKSSIAAATSK